MVFETFAAKLGMTETTFVLLILAAALFIYLLQEKISDPKKRKTYMFSAGTIIVIILVFSLVSSAGVAPTDNFSPVNSDWQERYASAAEEQLSDYPSMTRNTDYYDYEDEKITQVASDIAGSSKSSKEAMEKALAYVYNNVDYISGEPDSACFNGDAPSILASGEGQCDTQSIVLISLLRRMGIAAKPVGGCIVVNQKDCQLQSIFLNSLQDLGYAPQFTSMSTIPVVTPELAIYSRSATGSRSGGLHAWVTAWDSEEGWLTLEETTGKFANTNCYYYHVELFPTDNNKDDICVSKNYDYAAACQQGDFDRLDSNGLGVGAVPQ